MAIHHVGDTVRLSTTFKVGAVLTDPDTVTLAVTQGGVATTSTWAGATVTRDSPGAFHKDVVLTPAGLVTWKWTGTGAAAGVDEGSLTVESSLVGGPALISVEEVKDETESTVTDDDDLIQRLIVAASRYVMTYAGREFVTRDAPATARLFELNGAYRSRRVEIGDLTTLTSVASADGFGGASTALAVTDYVTAPLVRRADEPITALLLAPGYSVPTYSWPSPGVLSVTGTWGFPVIPEDVRHATVLIVREWLSKSSSEWGMPDDIDVRGAGLSPIRFAMPYASKQILDKYRRIGIA